MMAAANQSFEGAGFSIHKISYVLKFHANDCSSVHDYTKIRKKIRYITLVTSAAKVKPEKRVTRKVSPMEHPRKAGKIELRIGEETSWEIRSARSRR